MHLPLKLYYQAVGRKWVSHFDSFYLSNEQIVTLLLSRWGGARGT